MKSKREDTGVNGKRKQLVQLALVVAAELREQIDCVAEEEGLSRSDIVRIAVKDFIRRRVFSQAEKIGV